MNFPAANTLLDPTLPEHRDFLSRIQGNIVKGHGRTSAQLLLFRLKPGRPPPGRDFWSEVRSLVTSAWGQHEQARKRKSEPDAVFRGFVLSAAGLHALGVADYDDAALAGAPEAFAAFNAGMRRDAWCEFELRKTAWDSETYGRPEVKIHGAWLVASNSSVLSAAAKEVADFCMGHDLEILWPEPLTTWRKRGKNREAFGFVDGVSIPAFFLRDKARHRLAGPWMQMPVQALISPAVSARHAVHANFSDSLARSARFTLPRQKRAQ